MTRVADLLAVRGLDSPPAPAGWYGNGHLASDKTFCFVVEVVVAVFVPVVNFAVAVVDALFRLGRYRWGFSRNMRLHLVQQT